MAIDNFKPILWSKKILKDLDEQEVIVGTCTKSYSGEITGVGSKVTITSFLAPTIKDYVAGVTTVTPETLKDEARQLEITESKHFSISLDDIDKKQANDGALEEVIRKGTQALNDTREQFLAAKYGEAGITVSEASLSTANIYSTLMAARTKLAENNVGDSVQVDLFVTPDVYQKIVLADIVFSDGNQTAKKGRWSDVLGMMIYRTNNLTKVGRKSECIMKTKDAMGYAQQIMNVERFRPESAFADAVKALMVYGGKVIKPKEMAHLELTTVDETTV